MNGDDHEDRPPASRKHERTANVLSYTAGARACDRGDDRLCYCGANRSAVAPGAAVGRVMPRLAQIGVHLVFFLHLCSGPDDTNNTLALASGVPIVFSN
jgi:cytochrome o ubiquinol oxidase operon protein cyoD